MFAAAGTADEWTTDELKLFRLDHFVTEGQCPMIPVGFIVHCINHFFAVIFDYNRRTAHVLGRFISDAGIAAAAAGGQKNPNDWNSWDGPRRWSSIAILHGWGAGDSDDVRIIATNWIQNGVDCGPIACSVLEQALSSGLDDNGDLPLQSFHIPCGHILRIAMLKVIAGRLKKSCSDYLMFRDEQQAETGNYGYSILSDDEIHAIHTGQHQARCVAMLHTLYVASATCQSCHRHHAFQAIQTPNSANRHVDDDHARNATSEVDEEEGDEPDNQSLGDKLSGVRKENLVKLLKSRTMERFPRPTTPVPLSAYTGRRWLTDDRTFDNYEGGPTIEMLIPPIYVQPTMIYHSTGMELSAGWASWVDHGYRIRPSSFQMFYLCRPIETMEHIMPIGTTEFYDPSNQVSDRAVAVNDVICMSASEMNRLAKDNPPLDQPSASGHEIFICGRTGFSDGAKYICVDLERDSVTVDVDDVEVSVDIDSIIWTTSEFRLKGTVGIYMTPLFQSRPGIFKHNHVSIDILIPQSEEDFHAPGGRTEWLSKRFNMSAIPHICIGRISSASSILNLYMMFPRMIHRHPINGRMITLMPHEVIDLFYDKVLLPSIGHFNDISWDPYLKQTLEEARYKARGASGRPGGRGAPKIIPLSNDDFMKVQIRMHEIIKDGLEQLSMYGSCFFVLEGKGIKLLTKDGQRGQYSGPEEALIRNIPDLDWHHMRDRKHGELLVDIGVSLTPHASNLPLVGLWRLDALEASFGAGGYKRGDIHHHNTLSRYGAIQAEMQQDRSHQTHVSFRSAYNLYYEAVRTTRNQVSFASDSDAYKVSPSYMAECSDIIKILTGCKEKTYGVRDEYRVSGKAAMIILDEIVSKVGNVQPRNLAQHSSPYTKAKEYVTSHPILWIPSYVWFEFIARRVREIQRTQITIVKKNPPNLGVLTGILNHMLRATTSTPIVFDSHVRESLALIDYKTVSKTSGMLFLQEFDICSTTCLDDVQQVDDVHVLALMGVNAKAQRDRAVALAEACRDDVDSESEEFPLGRTPSWRRLKLAIANTPAVIMRPWTWPVTLFDASISVGRLFILFTRQIWLMLIDGVFKGMRPYPTTLQDSMRCWTVTSVDDTLACVTFEACNVGIQNHAGITPGRMGPRAKSFADRSAIFFPDLNATRKDCSQWDELWRGDGYIAEYHRALDGVEEAQQAALRSELREVFSNLHCLPASGGSQVWKVKLSAAVFITNPAFYRMDCLGNTDDHTIRRTKARRPMKILKGKRVFAADLMDTIHFDARGNLRVQTDRQKRRCLMKKMSMVNKNKRIPPPPRARNIRPFPMAREQS
ncbi:hypothetical protein BD769DRAFT_1369744 [Suillus cothurnatus]|nr:hypothetical protein BD769DRAFT_1369744 [Suillus cothurnatus]